MSDLLIVIEAFVFAGMMLGGIPGLALGRTGVALLGAIARPMRQSQVQKEPRGTGGARQAERARVRPADVSGLRVRKSRADGGWRDLRDVSGYQPVRVGLPT